MDSGAVAKTSRMYALKVSSIVRMTEPTSPRHCFEVHRCRLRIVFVPIYARRASASIFKNVRLCFLPFRWSWTAALPEAGKQHCLHIKFPQLDSMCPSGRTFQVSVALLTACSLAKTDTCCAALIALDCSSGSPRICFPLMASEGTIAASCAQKIGRDTSSSSETLAMDKMSPAAVRAPVFFVREPSFSHYSTENKHVPYPIRKNLPVNQKSQRSPPTRHNVQR